MSRRTRRLLVHVLSGLSLNAVMACSNSDDSPAPDQHRGTTERRPDSRYLVSATGQCPEFHDGPELVTFTPGGVPRDVLLYMSDRAREVDGPLIFSWHSTIPGPETSTVWLGNDVI